MSKCPNCKVSINKVNSAEIALTMPNGSKIDGIVFTCPECAVILAFPFDNSLLIAFASALPRRSKSIQ
jgi:RNase P subunit RPR2